jgi:hypothetical protein
LGSDFYVLEDLPVDVVFSSDFMFGHDVFEELDDWPLEDGEELLDVLRLCNIRLIGRYRKAPDKLVEEGLG